MMQNKVCTKCFIEYPTTEKYFVLDRRNKNGLGAWCRKCAYAANAAWQIKNLKKCKKYRQEHYQEIKKDQKEYYKNYRKTLRGYITQLLGSIKARCTNPNCRDYKNYGGREIKCKFTTNDLFSWIVSNNIEPRGKDIHRIDNDGNYTLENIEFMDRSLHRSLHADIRRQELSTC